MTTDVLVFNQWDVKGITIVDPGLKEVIGLTPRIVPKTGGKHAKNRFYKSKVFIVERFMNKMMNPGHKAKKHFKTSGHITGKSNTVLKMMKEVLTKLEDKTKENPIAVLVQAVENAAPREEIVTIEYGGARYPKAVECAPVRRIDTAVKLMVQGSYHKSFNHKKSMVDCLTDEILAAYKCMGTSHAVSKKLELERQADASR